jgi:hypothetical protein
MPVAALYWSACPVDYLFRRTCEGVRRSTTHEGLGVVPVQASKKEREKAKKERKEARKLAENPLQPMTEDAHPRDFINDAERHEVEEWVAQRKARFPTAARIEGKIRQANLIATAGAFRPLSLRYLPAITPYRHCSDPAVRSV